MNSLNCAKASRVPPLYWKQPRTKNTVPWINQCLHASGSSLPCSCCLPLIHQDRSLIAQLFEDWLQSDQCWLRSSTYQNTIKEKTSRRRGRAALKSFRELKDMFGLANAKIIRDKKKQAQLTKEEGEEDWWIKHPELPDVEELWYLRAHCNTHVHVNCALVNCALAAYLCRSGKCFGSSTHWPLKMMRLTAQSRESRLRLTLTQRPAKICCSVAANVHIQILSLDSKTHSPWPPPLHPCNPICGALTLVSPDPISPILPP